MLSSCCRTLFVKLAFLVVLCVAVYSWQFLHYSACWFSSSKGSIVAHSHCCQSGDLEVVKGRESYWNTVVDPGNSHLMWAIIQCFLHFLGCWVVKRSGRLILRHSWPACCFGEEGGCFNHAISLWIPCSFSLNYTVPGHSITTLLAALAVTSSIIRMPIC